MCVRCVLGASNRNGVDLHIISVYIHFYIYSWTPRWMAKNKWNTTTTTKKKVNIGYSIWIRFVCYSMVRYALHMFPCNTSKCRKIVDRCVSASSAFYFLLIYSFCIFFIGFYCCLCLDRRSIQILSILKRFHLRMCCCFFLVWLLCLSYAQSWCCTHMHTLRIHVCN